VNLRPPEILILPIYSYAESDAIASVSRGTSKRWVEGYSYTNIKGEKVSLPPVTPKLGGGEGVSFLDLVEVVAIGRFLEKGFTIRGIRSVVADCQRYFDLERPLVMARFKTGARQAFVERGGSLFAVGRQPNRGTYALADILGPFLEDLEYSGEWASRWWPLGHEQRIVIDPEYGFGQPVISGTGVRTEIIRERAEAGDLPPVIAKDFHITEEEVARAIQYELGRAA
jgi:uncharacterized protein (DUF433 family)